MACSSDAASLYPTYWDELWQLIDDDAATCPPVPLPLPMGESLADRLRQSTKPADLVHFQAAKYSTAHHIRADRPLRPLGPEEYFGWRLGVAMSALVVFSEIYHQVDPDERHEVSTRTELAYWNRWGGFLVAPRVRELLRWVQNAEPCDPLGTLEGVRVPILRASRLGAARREHARSRLHLLSLAQGGAISERLLCVGEFLADYMLIQRAIQGDVRSAGRNRAPAESTAAVVTEMWETGRTKFVRALRYVQDPEAMLAHLDGEIPMEIGRFATARARLAGRLLDLPQTGTPDVVLRIANP